MSYLRSHGKMSHLWIINKTFYVRKLEKCPTYEFLITHSTLENWIKCLNTKSYTNSLKIDFLHLRIQQTKEQKCHLTND